MNFGNSEMTVVLGVLLALIIIYVAYSLIKQLHTLEKLQERRIFDLMLIGVILYWLGIFFPQERSEQINLIQAAGFLIFLYGYLLLVLEMYREGRGG